MPLFNYSAFDGLGAAKKGEITAESGKQARRQLKSQGLLVSKLDVSKDSDVSKKNISVTNTSTKRLFESRLSNADLALIMEQLGVLLQSGMTLEEALQLLNDQSESSKQKGVVGTWHREILEGYSLSEAMRRSDCTVPERVVASVAVGEETGHLASIILRTAEELELGAENRQALQRGLSYPITLIVVATVVVTILMINVVPKITAVFKTSNIELPMVTKVVIGVSDFFIAYGFLCLILICLATAAALWWLRKDDNRRKWHKALLAFPVVGEWQRKANLSDWSRSLGTLLSSGVPALAALRISSAVVTNLHLRSKMQAVTNDVRDGNSVHSSLVKNDVGRGFLQHMVGSGEASSELDSMLLRVSDYYTSRLRNSVESFLKFMSPILIIVLGGLVLTIVSAVMLPILGMSEII